MLKYQIVNALWFCGAIALMYSLLKKRKDLMDRYIFLFCLSVFSISFLNLIYEIILSTIDEAVLYIYHDHYNPNHFYFYLIFLPVLFASVFIYRQAFLQLRGKSIYIASNSSFGIGWMLFGLQLLIMTAFGSD